MGPSRQKRKPKPRALPHEASDSDLSEEHVHQAPSDEVSSDDEFVYRTVQTTRSGRKTNVGKLAAPARRPEAAADTQSTWVQCENPGCLKWRRMRCEDVPMGGFQCSLSPDPRFARIPHSCTASGLSPPTACVPLSPRMHLVLLQTAHVAYRPCLICIAPPTLPSPPVKHRFYRPPAAQPHDSPRFAQVRVLRGASGGGGPRG